MMKVLIPSKCFSKFNYSKYKTGDEYTDEQRKDNATGAMILLYLGMNTNRYINNNSYTTTIKELLELFCSTNNLYSKTCQKYIKDIRKSLRLITEETAWNVSSFTPVDFDTIRLNTPFTLEINIVQWLDKELHQKTGTISVKQYKVIMKPKYRSLRIAMVQVLGYISSNWTKIKMGCYKIQVTVQAIANYTGLSTKTVSKILKILKQEKLIYRQSRKKRNIQEYVKDKKTGKYIYGANIYYLNLGGYKAKRSTSKHYFIKRKEIQTA